MYILVRVFALPFHYSLSVGAHAHGGACSEPSLWTLAKNRKMEIFPWLSNIYRWRICTFARKLISWSSNYMFFLKLNLHSFYMALSSLVWDASATMIDFPLENAINMRSVWTAWFQFWGKQNLLHIDVPFFRNILNVQHRIEWVHLDRLKKNIKMQWHLVIAFCVPSYLTPKIFGHRFAFECGFLF